MGEEEGLIGKSLLLAATVLKKPVGGRVGHQSTVNFWGVTLKRRQSHLRERKDGCTGEMILIVCVLKCLLS